MRPEIEELLWIDRAHSCMFTLPRTIAPAARKRATWNASASGLKPASASDPAVVAKSAVPMLSLRTIGIPCNGPRGPAAALSASSRFAMTPASGFTVTKVFSMGPASS